MWAGCHPIGQSLYFYLSVRVFYLSVRVVYPFYYVSVWRLLERKARCVALQFPEGLLMYALVISDILEQFAHVSTGIVTLVLMAVLPQHSLFMCTCHSHNGRCHIRSVLCGRFHRKSTGSRLFGIIFTMPSCVKSINLNCITWYVPIDIT